MEIRSFSCILGRLNFFIKGDSEIGPILLFVVDITQSVAEISDLRGRYNSIRDRYIGFRGQTSILS